MSSAEQHEELTDLLRQVVASNLTSAFQMELLRRSLQPEAHKGDGHPMAKVLEIFETMCEVMEEGMDDEGEEEELDDLGLKPPPAPKPESNPFASTVSYLKSRKR